MPSFEYSAFIVVTAPNEGEARGQLSKAQDLLEEQGMVLGIEDGVPVETDEEDGDDSDRVGV